MSSEQKREAFLRTLTDRGLIASDSIARASRLADDAGENITATLARLGLVSEEDLAEALSAALQIDRVPSENLLRLDSQKAGISFAFLRQSRILPLDDGSQGCLTLAMADPTDDETVGLVELHAGKPVARKVALATDLEAVLERLSASDAAQTGHAAAEAALHRAEEGLGSLAADVDRLREAASDAPVIRFVNATLARAVDDHASDVHFEPTGEGLKVRFRVDGRLRTLSQTVPLHMRDAIVSRLKLMAGLDIAERRLPQDGRIDYAVRGQDVDFRVATAPTAHGETVVVRVLDRAQIKLEFRDLGFDAFAETAFLRALRQPHGMVLVTGPTGSGKTTTLYAALAALNDPEFKLMTIEDPIEYQLAGVQQVQTHPAIGLTFARALRSFLRHNPNVVMVGEIRDLETAEVAVQVALTGHLVLSTLHTNDAASGVTRLLDMGVEDFLIASTCTAILAQRLVRRLCAACKAPTEIPERWRNGSFGHRGVSHAWRAVGCKVCEGVGYEGRTTILEVLEVSQAIRELIVRRASSEEIAGKAVEEGMRTMLDHGIAKVEEGLTTLEEILSAVRSH